VATLDAIDYFVVLMLENRSFDNLLGWLRPNSPGFEGLTGAEQIPDGTSGIVQVSTPYAGANAMREPDPDPGELFVDINTQLFGAPQGTPPQWPTACTMAGFATNYIAHQGSAPAIVHCFRPGDLASLTALANAYAVCDHWFASAPCQTWPNRFFVHTGTANGYENNSPVHFPYLMPTVFKQLEGAAPSGWKIYFHDFPHSLTLTDLWDRLDHFRPFAEFLSDAQAGTLPSYCFLEPRYFAAEAWPNDMHPPHNVTYGDQLIAEVYNAVRQSPCWPRTMLIITCDEHGGCFDHVPPPAALAPEAPRPGQVFGFNRYGVRVPTIVVSPLVDPGTVFRAPGVYPFDHTSIIATLRARFGIASALTARDAQAPTLAAALTTGNAVNDGPPSLPVPPSPPEDDAAALNRARLAPLNDFQEALHEAAAHLKPLADGVATAEHLQSLLDQWPPDEPAAANVNQALALINHVVGRLLPQTGSGSPGVTGN
jgi:phospholipase C